VGALCYRILFSVRTATQPGDHFSILNNSMLTLILSYKLNVYENCWTSKNFHRAHAYVVVHLSAV